MSGYSRVFKQRGKSTRSQGACTGLVRWQYTSEERDSGDGVPEVDVPLKVIFVQNILENILEFTADQVYVFLHSQRNLTAWAV